MLRRRLVSIVAVVLLGVAGGLTAAGPAHAGTFTCGARYFLKSAYVGKYYSVDPATGRVWAVGEHKGWWEQFQICRDSTWAPQFFVLRSEAMTAANNGWDAFLSPFVEGGVRAHTHTLTGNSLFEWGGDGNPYRGLKHAESGSYLTLTPYEPPLPYFGPTTLGWAQALYRET